VTTKHPDDTDLREIEIRRETLTTCRLCMGSIARAALTDNWNHVWPGPRNEKFYFDHRKGHYGQPFPDLDNEREHDPVEDALRREEARAYDRSEGRVP